MKTNVKELVDMMKSKGISVPELAQKIGVDASTLYRKLGAGGEKFTIGEVHRMMEAIPLSNEDANRIFYPLTRIIARKEREGECRAIKISRPMCRSSGMP